MSGQLQEQKKETVEVINASEDSVKVLLAKLKRIKAQKDEAVGGLVQDLLDTQEELRQKSASFDQESEKIEAQIKELMPAIAKTIKTEYGAANYRKGSVRTSYDTKALDACLDEYVKTAILPYRKETTVAASVSIEVY